MSLLQTKTQLEQDLEFVDGLLLQSARALHHAAAILRNSNAAFWDIPTDRLLAVLNADVTRTLAVFAANTATGTAINSQLDEFSATGMYETRAPVVPGRDDIVFDTESGLFVLDEPSA